MTGLYGFFWGFVIGAGGMLWYILWYARTQEAVAEKGNKRRYYPDGASVKDDNKTWVVHDKKAGTTPAPKVARLEPESAPKTASSINEVYATKELWERFMIDREAYRIAHGLKEREPGNLLFVDWKKSQV